MAFVRIRTIKGRKYRYQEERWRKGGKVRSRSICLGPASLHEVGRIPGMDWDAIENQMRARQQAEDTSHAALVARVEAELGVKLTPGDPVEVEKPVTVVDMSTAPDKANAPPDGAAAVSETLGP
jgi:hypothetical protein